MKATLPLLMLAEGRRPRARRAPKVRERELPLHMAVVDLLTKLCKPGWNWCHIPSGEKRDPRVGAKLRRMGTKARWPDIILIAPSGKFYGLELKAPTGELSDPQWEFQRWAVCNAVPYSVARSIDEVILIFGHWGCTLPIADGSALSCPALRQSRTPK